MRSASVIFLHFHVQLFFAIHASSASLSICCCIAYADDVTSLCFSFKAFSIVFASSILGFFGGGELFCPLFAFAFGAATVVAYDFAFAYVVVFDFAAETFYTFAFDLFLDDALAFGFAPAYDLAFAFVNFAAETF